MGWNALDPFRPLRLLDIIWFGCPLLFNYVMSHCVEATSVTCKCVSKHLERERCSVQTNNINGSNALCSFTGSLGYIFDLLNIKQPGKHISVQLWKAERERWSGSFGILQGTSCYGNREGSQLRWEMFPQQPASVAKWCCRKRARGKEWGKEWQKIHAEVFDVRKRDGGRVAWWRDNMEELIMKALNVVLSHMLRFGGGLIEHLGNFHNKVNRGKRWERGRETQCFAPLGEISTSSS